MLIRFESAVAGQNFAYGPQDGPVDWPDENEAKRFCAAGIAVELTQEQAGAASAGRPIRQHKPQSAMAPRAPEKMTSR